MPPKVGRPQLPKSTNEEVNARRKYYREYNRKRRIELLKLAEEIDKEDIAKINNKNKIKEKNDKCTQKVKEMKKKLDKCEKNTKEIIDEYDKAIKQVQKRKNSLF